MSIFNRDAEIMHYLDYVLLSDGSANFYHKKEVLDKDIVWLKEHSYEIISFDCSRWKSETDFYLEYSKKLQFPSEYPLLNLNSLNDWMRDIKFTGAGKVIIFEGFDSMLDKHEQLALSLLDILENHSRENLLFGDRLILLLQTNVPGIEIAGLGATSAKWNRNEWSYEDRGISENDIKTYNYKRNC